jgi:hypothetical protein
LAADPARILVVIPSRLQASPQGPLFLDGAVRSIVGQRLSRAAEINVAVGVDPGQETVAAARDFGAFVSFHAAPAASQAAALNAAAARLDHDYIAFLEDDDVWSPAFLDLALGVLETADFVSSTQLEIGPRGGVIGVNDFPIPSGWVMRRAVWEAVGGFDPSYRYHLDNDWLGRLAGSGAARVHLVESTAPLIDSVVKANRPQLHLVLTNGGPRVRLQRHRFAVPLVRRLVHPGSGMGQIRQNAEAYAASQAEYHRLIARYGRLPR